MNDPSSAREIKGRSIILAALFLSWLLVALAGCAYRSDEAAAEAHANVAEENHVDEVLAPEVKGTASDPAYTLAGQLSRRIHRPLMFCAGSAAGPRCWYLRPGAPPALCSDSDCSAEKALDMRPHQNALN